MTAEELLRRALAESPAPNPDQSAALGSAADSPFYERLLEALFGDVGPEAHAAMMAAAAERLTAAKARDPEWTPRPISSERIADSYRRSGLRPPSGPMAHGELGVICSCVTEVLLWALAPFPADHAKAFERVQRYLDAPRAAA
jgi:hypothetical protein